MDEDLQKWLSQMRKGLVELCVMLTLDKKGESYGFALLQSLKECGLELSEGTLYPLLNRMNNNKLLESRWQEPVDGGHPRKFYCLSEKGQLLLPQMQKQFDNDAETIKQLRN